MVERCSSGDWRSPHHRRWKPCFSKRLYRERNLIERFFSKLEHFRRVAIRYNKLAANFLAVRVSISLIQTRKSLTQIALKSDSSLNFCFRPEHGPSA
jgi:IS4 transposase